MAEINCKGRCLCGAVRISARAKSQDAGACHCTKCRNWGGGPMLTTECSDVQLEGAEHVSTFASSDWAERGFCGRCGTHLFYRLKQPESYFIPLGLLDRDQWTFDHQIFIDEKPPFYEFANRTKNLTGAEVFALYAAPSE